MWKLKGLFGHKAKHEVQKGSSCRFAETVSGASLSEGRKGKATAGEITDEERRRDP